MSRIVAEIFRRPDGSLGRTFYCIGDDEELDQAVTDTLLDLVAEMSAPSDSSLESLVLRAAKGAYVSPDSSLPDWSVNDKNVWLVPPMAKPGHICIANENTGEYSTEEGGQPQQFTYEQFRAALKHWREFRELMAREGKENLVGRRYEAAFPE